MSGIDEEPVVVAPNGFCRYLNRSLFVDKINVVLLPMILSTNSDPF